MREHHPPKLSCFRRFLFQLKKLTNRSNFPDEDSPEYEAMKRYHPKSHELLILNTDSSTLIIKIFCLLLNLIVILELLGKTTHFLSSYIIFIPITLGLIGTIFFLTNRKQYTLLKFEEVFDHYLKTTNDIPSYDKYKIEQLKEYDLGEYYRNIEIYYNLHYPDINFTIIPSEKISSNPRSYIKKCLIILKDLIEGLFCCRNSYVNELDKYDPPFLLSYYIWEKDEYFEVLFKYLNPLGLLMGSWLRRWEVLIIFQILLYFLFSMLINNYSTVQKHNSIVQSEFAFIKPSAFVPINHDIEEKRKMGNMVFAKIMRIIDANKIKAQPRRPSPNISQISSIHSQRRSNQSNQYSRHEDVAKRAFVSKMFSNDKKIE